MEQKKHKIKRYAEKTIEWSRTDHGRKAMMDMARIGRPIDYIVKTAIISATRLRKADKILSVFDFIEKKIVK